MNTPPDGRLDGPIHEFFGLSYSNYLVLQRTLMQSMPEDWQARAVALFQELDGAFPDQERATYYIVQPAQECAYSDLTLSDLRELDISVTRRGREEIYNDHNGIEHDPDDRLLVPLPSDPVPHYNRGRTYVEPTGLREVPDAS